MSSAHIFTLQLVLGYLAWLLCFRSYAWPWLRSMRPLDAHRVMATLHSFRFFGLAFVVPGVVGPQLPASFAEFAAYGDLATGALALLALLSWKVRPLFWSAVVAFNIVGMADLLLDYLHAIRAGLPALAGELAAAYAIPVIYVPLLMITHVAAFLMLLRPGTKRHASPGPGEPSDARMAGGTRIAG